VTPLIRDTEIELLFHHSRKHGGCFRS
jgi:hypothetical protein